MAELLYEIGTEELPAGYLEPALRGLAAAVEARLIECRLDPGALRTAGTPRRLTVAVEGIPASQPPLTTGAIGPPASIAFDEEGNPTAAAEGFARSKRVPVDALQVEETDKGPYLVAIVEEAGRTAADLLPDLLAAATAAIPFPKTMRWEPSGFAFARPIRWIVALLDDGVLPVEVAGVQAGRATRGHAFLAPGELPLEDASFDAYRDALRQRRVLVEPAERREAVRAQISELLAPHGSQLADEALLSEVTNMIEWPRAVEGRFDEHFLGMPDAIVTTAMKEHQRYFPVRDAEGRLLPRFITVSNRTAGQDELVREGNERVLLARLDDAKFYWEQDSARSLEQLVPRLADVVFLGGLGDNLRRTERLEGLAGRIAERMDGDELAEHARRAAHLCKADLLTGLVGEFPSLQGVVGRELARLGGEPEPVATAIAEHYLPSGADDELPATPAGAALALADRLDVIVGCFSIGLLPSGSQDPYALRRNALGVLLIIERQALELRLDWLVGAAREVAQGGGIACGEETVEQVLEFFRDRLYHAAMERGSPHDFVRAVLAAGCEDVGDFWRRLDALAECAERPWWPALVELVDRTYRIQRDLEEPAGVNEDLLSEPLERQLAAALVEHRDQVTALFDEGDYVAAAERYQDAFARLVHDFFEDVFVNVEEEAVRVNRKSLCGHVFRLFADRFANLYLIETARPEDA
jgi:glycyl-tRNA synthetase beta chain